MFVHDGYSSVLLIVYTTKIKYRCLDAFKTKTIVYIIC